MKHPEHVHLGYEVGTGIPIEIPLLNLAVTGQTQQSGKTTTLEALVTRAKVDAIAFVTKRGEGALGGGPTIEPCFRDRADWQFVSSIIDATLQEKNKFLRPWIMKICRTTRTLADVHTAVRKALLTAKGIHEGVYTQLDAYLDLIVPEMQSVSNRDLRLRAGLNVMNISAYSTPMQMLFVQSAIDWVNEHCSNVVVIVPEAWEFIPQGKSSPVKNSAISLVRKGSAIGNHIWVDSQDMAGVEKTILRGCPVWLIGVQREANEIKRNLDNIPAGIKRPSAADIANLGRGQFYACWKDRTVKVYVQPSWMDGAIAQKIANGMITIPVPGKSAATLLDRMQARSDAVQARTGILPEMEDDVTLEEADKLIQENKRLRDQNAKLLQRIETLEEDHHLPPPKTLAKAREAASSNGHLDEDALFERFKRRLLDDTPVLMRVLLSQPEIEVKVERRTIELDGSSLQGAVAILIKEGFFDDFTTGNAVYNELRKRGVAIAKPTAYTICDKLNTMGFLIKQTDGYRAVGHMKVNIVK